MKILSLVLKDLSQALRDWQTAFFMIVVPVIFTLLLGFIFGAADSGDARLPVGLVDLDRSTSSAQLTVLLDRSDAIRVVEIKNAQDAQKQVVKNDLAAAVVVPQGYGSQLFAEPVRLTILIDETSTGGWAAQNGIQSAVARLMGAAQAAQLSLQALETQTSLDRETEQRAFLDQAVEQAIEAWRDPPIRVEIGQSQAIEQEDAAGASGFAHSSPANMVQFSMMGVIGMAGIVLQERKTRTMHRMLTMSISRAEIIMGHFLAIFTLSFAQVTLMVAFGALALGVNYLREPIATLLMMVTVALWASSIGLLIGVISKSDEQVAMFSIIPTLVLAGLGGAWMPLEFTPKSFQMVGHLSPVAWAMDGFENIVVRGLGFSSVLLPAGVLFAYALAFFILAIWRFRID